MHICNKLTSYGQAFTDLYGEATRVCRRTTRDRKRAEKHRPQWLPSGSGGSLMDIQHCVNNEMVIGCGSFHAAGMAFNDIFYTF